MRRILTVLALAVAAIAALAISPVAQVDAQQNASWRLEFFDNPYLVGPAVYTTQTQGIGYNWGDGSPNAAVPADNFSARFSTDVVIPAGTYRFYMLADDGAHLYVDFQSIINTFDSPQPGQVQQTDVTAPGGQIHIQIDFVEYDSSSYFYLDWQNVANNPTGPDFGQVGSQPTPGGQWSAEYYNNTSLSGAPVITRSEPAPNHSWGTASPIAPVTADNFSVRWHTVQSVNQAGHVPAQRPR
jgi:hypothetical protein